MKYIILSILAVIVCFAALAGFSSTAQAQTPVCTDPTGNPIPCPTEEPKEEENSTQTPVIIYYTSTPTAALTAPSTSTPVAVATSLPLAVPTDETITTGKHWSSWCENGKGKKIA